MGERLMRGTLECDNCEWRQEYPRTIEGIEAIVKDGWRLRGSIIYCPECVSNHKNDQEINSEDDTAIWLYRRVIG